MKRCRGEDMNNKRFKSQPPDKSSNDLAGPVTNNHESATISCEPDIDAICWRASMSDDEDSQLQLTNSFVMYAEENARKRKTQYINSEIEMCSNKTLHACIICNQKFSTQNLCEAHLKKVHSNNTPNENCKNKIKSNEEFCKICNTYFNDEFLLHTHVKNKHGDIALINCYINSKIFQCKYANKNIDVFCGICNVEFSYKDYFSKHLENCYKNSDFRCPFCSVAKCEFENNLSEHMKRHIYLTRNLERCNTCIKYFLSAYNKCIHKSQCQ